MNQYPLWKYLLILFVLLLGTIYALPNTYPGQPAVQIAPAQAGNIIEAGFADEVKGKLAEKSIKYDRIELDDNKLVIRFTDNEQQLWAKDFLKETYVTEGQNNKYAVALNLVPSTPGWLEALGAMPMYLGLDLRGGVYFLMEVDMNAAVQLAEERYVSDLTNILRSEKIRYLRGYRIPPTDTQNGGVEIKFRDAERRNAGLTALKDEFQTLEFSELDRDGEFFIVALLTDSEITETKRFAMQQNLSTLRNRVNEIGVAEPVIQQQGDSRIVIQLPGLQDPQQAVDILGATATLEYRAVDDKNDVQTALAGRVPAGSRLYKERDGNPVLLKKQIIATGDMITNATSGIDDQSGGPRVSVTLDDIGAKRMLKFTKANVGKPMAVVYIETNTVKVNIDGKLVRKRVKSEEVISIANVLEPFSKRFQTTGLDSINEASQLALLLRAGSLATPVDIVEERTVGPSLGQDNIDQGTRSVIIGFVWVLAFMLFWYRSFGMIANLALAVNLVLIVAVLSLLQATLTLPGIAGIVLTVGMAVDANVLIFERIREELRLGNSPQASIASGYEKAFSTIADANITTLIAAVVLFVFGTGPVKGFAITLSIGIMTSMFTAIMGTRAVANLMWGRKRLTRVSIGAFKKTLFSKINFMGQRKLAIILSALLVVGSIGSLASKGLNFGVDFTGGTIIEVGYTKPVELAGVREALAKDYGDAQVQHFGTARDIMIRMAPREGVKSTELSSNVLTTLRNSTSDSVEIRRVEFVGPQVGEELTEQGAFAILYALGFIFVYIFLRFQWQYSVGAVSALFHDVIITLGFFSFLQLEFDLTVLAAVLAVIGYSLNDTIVVYDRIRENFRKLRKLNPFDVVNVSINETFSRTIITSLTTVLVLLALFFLGGELIHGFATALLVGVLVGTYSSIYVASNSALSLGINKADMTPVKAEGASPDGSQV